MPAKQVVFHAQLSFEGFLLPEKSSIGPLVFLGPATDLALRLREVFRGCEFLARLGPVASATSLRDV